MPVISLPAIAMGPFGMPMIPGDGSSGGGASGTYGTLTKTVNWDTIKGSVESTVDSWGFYPAGYTFNNDGTKMYVCARSWQTGTANDYNYTQVSIAQYNLSTAYDIATATYDKINNTVVAGLMGINDVAWNADGTKAFIAVAYENTYNPIANRYQIWECACSSAYDVSGINVSSPTNVMIMPNLLDPQSLLFSHDGKKIFAAGDTQGIFTVDLTTAYSFTGHTTGHTTANSCITSAQMGLGSNLRLWGISFSNDGITAFITQGQAGANNQQWKLTLATAYDLTSYSNTETLTIGDVYVYDKSLITFNNVTNNVTFGSFSGARRWKYNETGPISSSSSGASDAGFYSRIPENWGGYAFTGQSDSMMRGHMTKQATDGSYYTVGRNIDGNESSWLIKRDSTGAFVWIRAWGNLTMRANFIVIDSNSNPICISHDYGYYQQAGTGGITSHIIKFDPSGAEQYKKVFNFTNASTNDHSTYLRAATIDAWDNIWGMFTYNDGVTSPQNYSKQTIGLARIDTSNGSLVKVYTLPPSGTFSANETATNPIHIDENNRMYLGWMMYPPAYSSTYYGVVARMDITENGDPTYVWTKRYGTNYATQNNGHDFARQISTLSTGEVIVAGYSKITYLGITDSYGSSHPFGGTLMSLSATDGSVNWSKILDPDITNDQYSMATTDDDKIFVGITDQINYGDNIQIREINSSNGDHVNMWDFNNKDQSTWRYHLEEGTGIQTDNNGNIIITVNPYVAGTSDYYPDLMKLPKTMITGTFGSTISGLSGGLILSSNSNTPSDFTYSPINQTFSSYSTVTDVTSGFGMYAYNTGSGYNDTVFTPTTTDTSDVTVIEAAGGGGTPQGWISTISDELNGYGYNDVKIHSLAVDSNDNIIAAGGTSNIGLVVKIKPDGTVDSAASFGVMGATLLNKSVAVDSGDNIWYAGKANNYNGALDGYVMKLTNSLTKVWDNFFGEGYVDQHYDIATNGTDAYAVGESTSYVQNWNNDPKGYLVKYNSSGGEWKLVVSTTQSRAKVRGVSSDGNDTWVIGRDEYTSPIWIANFSSNQSLRWSKSWGSSSVTAYGMDIDCNPALLTQSVSCMYETGFGGSSNIKVLKLTAQTLDWQVQWQKASTDHGTENPGYNFSSGLAVKLLSNGSVALLALGSVPWTTQSYTKSFYIIIFDSSGNVTVEKEFRLADASHYFGINETVHKALVELSDGKIVTAMPYYTGSEWKNGIFKFDPTDTTTAINGTHGDWVISEITDSTSTTSGSNYSSGSVLRDYNMSMYFKTGTQNYANGYSAGSTTVVEGTQQALSGGGGGGGAASYFGDKALFAGSSNNNPGQIDTLDITTTANATNFGSLGRYAYAMAAMSNGTRAVFAGGDNNITAIEYVTFATYSAPVTFGSTLATQNSGSWGSVSDGTYGVYPANMNLNGNSLEYITIATTSNGTDFGDMYIAGDRRGGASDGTYGLISGGRSGGSNSTVTSTDRITIATPGNATDFGNNTQPRMNLAGMGDGTYAVFAGGLKITQPYVFYNTMEYFTVATPSNATYFGALVTGKSDTGATNNATRGVIAGGSASGWQEQNSIDYITITTPGNATSFGNLPTTKAYPSGTSGT